MVRHCSALRGAAVGPRALPGAVTTAARSRNFHSLVFAGAPAARLPQSVQTFPLAPSVEAWASGSLTLLWTTMLPGTLLLGAGVAFPVMTQPFLACHLVVGNEYSQKTGW